MTWILFLLVAAVIVVAGTQLARYGDVIGERTGLGQSWAGVVLLAATTSLPEFFTGFSATALSSLPDIAVGNVLGACMINLLILSLMDAVHPEPLTTRAHQGHALSIGFGLILIGVTGLGLIGGPRLSIGWVGVPSLALLMLYPAAMRVIVAHEGRRQARERAEVAEVLHPDVTLRTAAIRYGLAAAFVIAAAIWLPALGAEIATKTGLSEGFVGSVFIAATTTLPEIVVSLAAVRMGATDLGVGNILGSNLFNLFILGLFDVFYRQGPLLASVDSGHLVPVLAVVIMNAVFLIGLTYRTATKRFVVQWDTAAIVAVYAIGLIYLAGR
jgi:cation:H+ antiporter